MTSQARRILEAALALPDEERRLIAIELRDSLATTGSVDDVAAAWVLPSPWRARTKNDSSHDAVPETHLLGELEYSATDYFGNEAGDSAFYVSATLLLEVPRASQRPTVQRTPSTRRRSTSRRA